MNKQDIKQAWSAIQDNLEIVIQTFLDRTEGIVSAVYQIYLDEGAIYGESMGGCTRWLEERAEIARLRREADRIEQHHAMLKVIAQHKKPDN